MDENEIRDDKAGRDKTIHDLFRVYELVLDIHACPIDQKIITTPCSGGYMALS